MQTIDKTVLKCVNRDTRGNISNKSSAMEERTSDDSGVENLKENQNIELVAAELSVSKQTVAETVIFEKSFITEKVEIPEELRSEEIAVNRIPINQEVTAVPGIRMEGDTTIIPVVKEVAVIQKKLVLVEEIHVTKNTSLATEIVSGEVRHETFEQKHTKS